jgi:hypothetical protein
MIAVAKKWQLTLAALQQAEFRIPSAQPLNWF